MRMIDIAGKKASEREAVVEGAISIRPEVIRAIKNGTIPKGDVLGAARIAGILAAKKTSSLIPLCHPIPIDYVNIEFYPAKDRIKIRTTVRAHAKTGVEMEAFTATAVAALTIYDMTKALDREGKISTIMLIKKTGGKSGTYFRKG